MSNTPTWFSEGPGTVRAGTPRALTNHLLLHTLVLPMEFEFQNDPDPVVSAVGGTLAVRDRGQTPRRVGSLSMLGNHVPRKVRGARNWEFAIDLGSAEIDAMNGLRDEHGDLNLTAELSMIWIPHNDLPRNSPASVLFRIPSSDWLKLLQTCGACDVLTVSFGIPPADADLAEVVAFLRKAQFELYSGRQPRVICRYAQQALEALMTRLDDADALAAARESKSRGPVEQRLHRVRLALQDLAGGAMHADAATLAYDMPIAKALLGMTIALLQAYSSRFA